MMEKIDARGFSCPTPVMMVKAALDKGAQQLEVWVDNGAARDNISRHAKSRGKQVTISVQDGDYVLTIQ